MTNKMEKPLCISTLDLEFFKQGGVVVHAMAFACAAQEEGYSPFFLTPSTSLHRTLRRSLKFQFPTSMRKTEFHGFPCYQMGAQYPEFESNAHRFNSSELRRILSKNIPCFAISGNNHAARPFLDISLPYSLLPGTTYWEDCRHRILQAPWSIRKILDLVSKPSCERLEKKLFENAKKIAVTTTYVRNHMAAIDPRFLQKTTWIPIPVDCEKYSRSLNPKLETLLCIGRLTDPRKNIPLVLDAFASMGKHRPNLKLTLIGSGASEVRKKLETHPYSKRIEVFENISEAEKIQHIQNALALVISSHQEGFGITGSEALACGVPVISTPCGGTGDFVINDMTGIMLESFSVSEMADAILRISGDPALQKQLGQGGREFALERLSLQAVVPKLKEFIHSSIT